MNLMKYKLWYFLFSLALIIPGSYVLLTSGLKLGIDFTGGSLLEYRFEKQIALDDLKQYGQITPTLSNTYIIRSQPKTKEEVGKIKKELETKFGKIEERRQEFVGPVIGRELLQKYQNLLHLGGLGFVPLWLCFMMYYW